MDQSKKKKNTEGGRRGSGGKGEGEGRARGNSFANQALALRSISSWQWVPGVNKVISFNPALQLNITPSSREYLGLFIGPEGGNSNLAVGWLHTPEDKSLHIQAPMQLHMHRYTHSNNSHVSAKCPYKQLYPEEEPKHLVDLSIE